jgi:hypothetical protein
LDVVSNNSEKEKEKEKVNPCRSVRIMRLHRYLCRLRSLRTGDVCTPLWKKALTPQSLSHLASVTLVDPAVPVVDKAVEKGLAGWDLWIVEGVDHLIRPLTSHGLEHWFGV